MKSTELYKKNAFECSRLTTRNYSTSFSFGIRLFKKKYRMPIYGIYGFVRFADEIVDSFHDFDKKQLLDEFKHHTWLAIQRGISTNPVLHSFQHVVNTYGIDTELIEAFLQSMEMDLTKTNYSPAEFKKYVYGSAEVVGLMCLQIFYANDRQTYQKLVLPAKKLGEAFQKINFLRDIKDDFLAKGRLYFPKIDFENFSQTQKKAIEQDIRADFQEALKGIKQLKKDVRLGIFLAYNYYLKLLYKIEQTSPQKLLQQRYRISNFRKGLILIASFLRHKINWL